MQHLLWNGIEPRLTTKVNYIKIANERECGVQLQQKFICVAEVCAKLLQDNEHTEFSTFTSLLFNTHALSTTLGSQDVLRRPPPTLPCWCRVRGAPPCATLKLCVATFTSSSSFMKLKPLFLQLLRLLRNPIREAAPRKGVPFLLKPTKCLPSTTDR